jgi:predicted enzyme related to lactoylglutathione lyase
MLQVHHQNARNIFPIGVRVYVSDVERSHSWYAQVLGLHMKLAPDHRSSQHVISYGEDQEVTVFYLVGGLRSEGHHSTVSLSFQVPDLEGTIASLKSAGVQMAREIGIEPGTALRSATILDPDGHGIVIFEC